MSLRENSRLVKSFSILCASFPKDSVLYLFTDKSVIIDDEHKAEEETVLRTFEEYENLCFGRVNDKIKVVDSIKTLNEKLHSDGINEKLRSQFVGTCLLALKNGLVYKNIKETIDPQTGKKVSPEKVVLKSIINYKGKNDMYFCSIPE